MEESSDTQEQLKDEKQSKALATDTYSKDDGTSKEESGSEPVKLRGQLKRNKRSLIFRNSLGAALMEQFTNSYLRENRLHQLECVLDWKEVKYEIKPTRLDKAKAYFNPLAPKPTVKKKKNKKIKLFFGIRQVFFFSLSFSNGKKNFGGRSFFAPPLAFFFLREM